MDSIEDAVKTMPGFNQFQKEYDRIKREVLQDPLVRSFLSRYPTLSDASIEKGLTKLYEYSKEQKQCSQCPGLQACPNLMAGYQPHLEVEKNQLSIYYEKCSLKKQDEHQKSLSARMQSYFIPKDILEASFTNLTSIDEDRKEAIGAGMAFVKKLSAKEEAKGLYFYGKFGVGKTYLLGAIANALAERGISSLLIHTPEFLREMKSSLSDGTFNEKMELLKTVPVLMLDDLGAENMTNWVRDEIIGVILQYRMMERLPTLYSSNYDFEFLEEHFSYSQKGGLEEAKAKRIMERIRHLATPIFIGGDKNFRANQ
ncbi:primosomal protein DnaI [Fictibacillus macauensis ZFHKF-1]|uniref:Primosomal protein DnaI n=1 Tax=Fictibacillus macauensis ZFHKF-1 TaxID=1196324 RepID=I8J0Y6_9BACL|nr:primosomal protein DnaI [Fictibacillus macauensis]EIT85421.1 primosomal protein DnaI [Fictibacillus macauensis ZFHKF-1]